MCVNFQVIHSYPNSVFAELCAVVNMQKHTVLSNQLPCLSNVPLSLSPDAGHSVPEDQCRDGDEENQ